MKKVLYIGKYNGIIGGIERYMQTSAELLRRNGYEVDYLYTENGGYDCENFRNAFDIIQKFSENSELINLADIIIIHNIIPVEVIKNLPENRVFFFAHDHNIYCRRHHYYWPVGRINCHRAYSKLFCKLCSLGRNEAPPLTEYRRFSALVLSDFVADNLRKNGFKKIVKLPAFIKEKKCERSILQDNVLHILFLGQLIRGKGADLLLQSLSELAVPFDCVIAGSGKDKELLESLVEKFNLSDKVHFMGFVNDVDELLSQCDVLAFPIRWQEPFGLVGVEAMAHGVPIVAFDLGGVREWLADNENGKLVPEKDCTSFAAALADLAKNPDKIINMGRCGLKMAKEKFSEEKFIETFERLLEEIK